MRRLEWTEEATTFLLTIAGLLRDEMPELPMSFRYRAVLGEARPSVLVLERNDGRIFVVRVREESEQ